MKLLISSLMIFSCANVFAASCSLFLEVPTKGCTDLEEAKGREAAKIILENKGYELVSDEATSRFKTLSGFACIEYEDHRGPGPFDRNLYTIKMTDKLNNQIHEATGTTMYFIKDHEVRSLKKAFKNLPDCDSSI